MPDKVWEHLFMDFIKSLPPSGGYTTVIVVVNRF